MAVERLRGLGERISLKVEGPLWQTVCDYPGVDEILADRLPILLVGTEENLRLASEILKTHPKAKITVVEKDEAVVKKAGRWIRESIAIKVIQGEFPHVSLPERDYGLAIAKNLIHFLSEEELKDFVDGVGKALSPRGFFFASTPPLFSSKPWYKLQKLGIPHKGVGIKGLFGGTLFVFKDFKKEVRDDGKF